MGLPLGDIQKGELVQYKDPFINNKLYRVEDVTMKATGRGHNIDRVKINGHYEMASLLERPDEGMAKDEPV